MAVSEITLVKGAYNVTVYANQIEDGIVNKVIKITPPTGKQKQDAGAKATKVIDLLRLTRTFRILGYITGNTDKGKIISMIEGAGTKGGGVTFSYDAGGDATSFTVFVESCIFTHKAADEPASPPTDFAKFDVNLTLVKGTTV